MRPIPLALCAVLAGVLIAVPQFLSADDNTEANRLIVETVGLWNEAQELRDDGSEVAERRVALLAEVVANLNTIVNVYPGSDIAVQLVIGQTIGPLSQINAQEALVAAHDKVTEEEEEEEKEEANRAADAARSSCFAEPSASCVFFEALDVAERVEDERDRSRAFAAIAGALARAGLFTEALETARSIEDNWERARTLVAIAEASDDPTLFTEALETARRIEGDGQRGTALEAIAEALARAGLFTEALETVGYISLGTRRSSALAAIAEALAGAAVHDAEQ